MKERTTTAINNVGLPHAAKGALCCDEFSEGLDVFRVADGGQIEHL